LKAVRKVNKERIEHLARDEKAWIPVVWALRAFSYILEGNFSCPGRRNAACLQYVALIWGFSLIYLICSFALEHWLLL